MAVDEVVHASKYDSIKLNIASGTQITTKAATVIQTLSKSCSTDKPTVVSLGTKSRNANKLISIVEIAKRDLSAKGLKVYQYNALSSQMVELERKPKQADRADEPGTTAGEVGDDSDDAFETMGEKGSDGSKKRMIPVMTVCLSTSSIKDLKAKFGYDISASILMSRLTC